METFHRTFVINCFLFLGIAKRPVCNARKGNLVASCHDCIV